MKNRKLFRIISMITSSLLICPSYASERGRKSLPQSEQDVIKEIEEGHEGASKRVQKRAEARDLQKKGKAFGKDVKTVTKPLSKVGTIAGFAASASGDPQAKMAAAAFKLSIVAVEQLGVGVSKIIMGVGRYQERSQEVLSNAEILLEEIQKSIDKKESLEKKISGLLKIEKPLGPPESSSRLKQFAKGAQSAMKTAEIKVRQATDVLTDEKAKREEKIKAFQADLKVENENYAENIRLLQILVMQDALEQVEKKIDIEGTIATLESNIRFFKDARDSLSKSKSKRKKQMAKIEKDEAANNKDLLYYLKFQKSPTETLQELENDRSELLKKIKELTALTKRGETLYLQKREASLDSQVNRTAIVGIYKELDAMKEQLEKLSKTLPAKDTGLPPRPKQSLETAKSQKGITPKPALGTEKDKGNGGLSREAIIEQKKNLRHLPVPPTGKAG